MRFGYLKGAVLVAAVAGCPATGRPGHSQINADGLAAVAAVDAGTTDPIVEHFLNTASLAQDDTAELAAIEADAGSASVDAGQDAEGGTDAVDAGN
jgi:hypothetical protein